MVDQFWTLPLVSKFWADHKPDAEAFIFLNKYGRHSSLKAHDIYVMAGRFATRLRQCGLTSGDVIANAVLNSPERVVSDLGIFMAGCISLNCQILETDGGDFWNTANVSVCKAILLPHIANDAALKLLSPYILGNSTGISGYRDIAVPKAPALRRAFIIARLDTLSKDTRQGGHDAMSGRPNDEHKQGKDESPPQSATKPQPLVSAISSTGDDSFLRDLLESKEEVFMADCKPTDDVIIFTTSGSTGYCKLVPRTHEELLRMARREGTGGPTMKYFTDRELGWLGGFPFEYYKACSPLYVQDAFGGQKAKTVKEIWDLLVREQCDGAFLPPAVINGLVEIFQGKAPEFKLKFIFTAGQPLKGSAVAAIGVLGDLLFNMYASTETGAVTVFMIKDAAEFKDFACGYPIKGVQLRVVDDNLQDLPPGQEGSVLVKSPHMFRHYYNYTPPEPVFTADGWFMIKDRGMMDEKGILYVGCRQGDVITQGTVLVYMSWPESVISKCPDVNDVTVVAVKDDRGDDKLCACVTTRKNSGLTEELLRQFYDDNFKSVWADSEFKPHISYFMFYDVLPTTATGKLDKKKMKEDACKKFKLPGV